MERNCATVILLNVLRPATSFISGPDLDDSILDFRANAIMSFLEALVVKYILNAGAHE